MKRLFSFALFILLLTGCTLPPPGAGESALAATLTAAAPALAPSSDAPTAFLSLPPTATFTPPPPPTITPTPTATWEWNPPGQVVAPILLYHHVSNDEPGNRYYVSPANFETQLQSLLSWGYTVIPMSLLVEALIDGADLPARPIVITFDDGDLDVYENAFPIMQRLNMSGVFYIVANRLNSKYFAKPDQLKEMLAAGWEVGSHSMTHSDLTFLHESVREEILQSRLDLEDALDTTILTFAYPFGTVDWYLADRAQAYGYRAAVGLGKSWTHTLNSLYYLSRIEVHGDMDFAAFAGLLPWSDAP